MVRGTIRVMVNWHVAPIDNVLLPSASARSLPKPSSPCELCGDRPRAPLSNVLVIDGPDGLPVPFLVCGHCRKALVELHALLASASRDLPPLV